MTKILLTGRTGQLGWELQHALMPLGPVIAPDRSQMDLNNPDAIRKVIRSVEPDIIVNAAGYTTVDKAEAERDVAFQVNAIAPGIMADEANQLNALLVHYSTDYVYDGTKSSPYTEEDTPNPVNFYGQSKLAGEQAIVETGCKHLILRASWIYSARGTNFVRTILRLAREKRDISVVTDQVGCPSWAQSLAASSAEILRGNRNMMQYSGVYHLSAVGPVTRFDFARMILSLAHRTNNASSDLAEIRPTTTENYPLPARRPLSVATSKDKISRCFGIKIATWEEQLDSFMRKQLNAVLQI